MGCSNCFNGCGDTISDQCVKYTGIDIPGLGISVGDPLLVVENQIISKILELITGAGIIPIINAEDLCSLVSSYLPVSGEINLNQVISALFNSICVLDTRVTNVEGELNTLNANYVIECLSGVSIDSGTHDILQATINKLCEVDNSLELLEADLEANYVLISEIDSYIAAYLAGIPSSSLYNSKMIPYVAVPYFGTLSGIFDITGAGIGDWEKIYLCNGQNSTPDLRGRVLVGTTTMGNTPFSAAVDPAIVGNPTYSINTTVGANQAFLTDAAQLPPHIHSANIVITDPGHLHSYTLRNATQSVNGEGSNDGDIMTQPFSANTTSSQTGISAVVTVGSTGASEGHNNIQPVHAVNFIIYIP